MYRITAYLLCQIICLSASASEPMPAEWAMADFADRPNQRVALLVTPQINGIPCKMQIDTGANRAVIWHDYKQSKAEPVQLSVTFAGITKLVPAQPEFAKQISSCQKSDIVGTLGNAFFEQGSLSIDLKTPAITYTPGSILSGKSHAQPMFYARWDKNGGHTLVELRNDGSLVGYALLDTGSTALGLGVLSDADWHRATNGAPIRSGKQVRSFKVHAWGREHDCYMYTTGTAVQVGTSTNGKIQVQYCPTLEFKPAVKLAGVLGMSLFGKSTIVIDYQAGRWAIENSSPTSNTSL